MMGCGIPAPEVVVVERGSYLESQPLLKQAPVECRRLGAQARINENHPLHARGTGAL